MVHLNVRRQIIGHMTSISRVCKSSDLIKFELLKSSKQLDHEAGSLEVNIQAEIQGASAEKNDAIIKLTAY